MESDNVIQAVSEMVLKIAESTQVSYIGVIHAVEKVTRTLLEISCSGVGGFYDYLNLYKSLATYGTDQATARGECIRKSLGYKALEENGEEG